MERSTETIFRRTLSVQFGGLMGSQRDPWFIEASPYNLKSCGGYGAGFLHGSVLMTSACAASLLKKARGHCFIC